MAFKASILILIIFTTTATTTATRGGPTSVPGYPFGIPGFGNGLPGFGKGPGWAGGYGGGYSGPHGSRSWGGIATPSIICRERGPCHNKRLTCPAKCFKSWKKQGRGYGGGGGGGGCTMDCKKCIAYC